MVNSSGYLDGCTSTSGYSATTGYSCDMAVNGIIYTGGGTTVNTGLPATTVTTSTSPGLPTTGAGQDTLVNLAVLLGSGLVAALGIHYMMTRSVSAK